VRAGTHLTDGGTVRAVSPAASSDAFRKRRAPGIGAVAFVRSLLMQLQPGMDTYPRIVKSSGRPLLIFGLHPLECLLAQTGWQISAKL
jgi:hypothetical protein